MKIAISVGLAQAPELGGVELLRVLRGLATECAQHGWALWLRQGTNRSSRQDPWILLAALAQHVPDLQVGVLASFPAETRISDLEDTLVLDNLTGGRLEVALLPSNETDRTEEVVRGLAGQQIERGSGEERGTFVITPRCARRAIPVWIPLETSSTGNNRAGSMMWSLHGQAELPTLAALFPAEADPTIENNDLWQRATASSLAVIEVPVDYPSGMLVQVANRWREWPRQVA